VPVAFGIGNDNKEQMTPAKDPFNLQRFVDAQERVYEQVCAELRNGQKESHWIWFIFPLTCSR